MARKNSLSVLGATNVDQRVFLFRHVPADKTDTFQIDTSLDGINFSRYDEGGEIIKLKGKREPLSHCQDFRLSEIGHLYFLVYRLTSEKQTSVYSAVSYNFLQWQRIGKISRLNQPGMLLPDPKHPEKFLLLFGGQAIRQAKSSDLKKWQILKRPLFSPPSDSPPKPHLIIGNLFLLSKGILLVFYQSQKNKRNPHYSLQALLLDKENPQKSLWSSPKTIWEQKEVWPNQAIIPLGVVRLADQLISYWQTQKGDVHALTHPYFLKSLQEEKPISAYPLLGKFRKNPLLKPVLEHFWESQAVFNPAAVYDQEKVHLVYRAVGDQGVSVLGYASSPDGLHIDQRLKEPIFYPTQAFEGSYPLKKMPSSCSVRFFSGGGCGGCEDPRLTKIDGRYYLIYVSFNGWSPPRLAKTSIAADDFLNHRWNWEEPTLISPPGVVDKSGCLLPEKIKDKYVIFHRVYPDILIDFVDSLDFDGQTWLQGQYRIRPRKNSWDSRKIGVGPTPIKTADGWLIIYNAVDSQDDRHYKMGSMMVDLKDPTQVLYRCQRPILEPSEFYENNGLKYGVVYPCGAAVINQRLFVYYGGSDTFVCVATAPLKEFLTKLKSTGTPQLEPVNQPINLQIN